MVTAFITSENIFESVWAYFEKRPYLADHGSGLQWFAECKQSACKDKDRHILITVVDLFAAANYLDQPVISIYKQRRLLSLLAQDHTEYHTDWIKKSILIKTFNEKPGSISNVR